MLLRGEMNEEAMPSSPRIDHLRCVIWLAPACIGVALMYALTHWGRWVFDLVVFVYPVVVVLLGRADAKLRCRRIREDGGVAAFGIWGHAWRYVAVQVAVVALVLALVEWMA